MEHILKKIENCPILQEKTGLWRTQQNKNDLENTETKNISRIAHSQLCV